jgi:hypothetical protein
MNIYKNRSAINNTQIVPIGAPSKNNAVVLPDNRTQSIIQQKNIIPSEGVKNSIQQQPSITQSKISSPIIQKKAHKPKVGMQVRYPATGPGQGAVYNVIAVDDGGGLQIRTGATTHNKNWKNDAIWIERAVSPLDTDRRQEQGAWALLTKGQKSAIYTGAKNDAVTLIKNYVVNGMINQTNKNNLTTNLKFSFFNKKKKGEWVCEWSEPGERKWQLTIDMDDPLETSDQEPHVGWEVKLISPGKNGVGEAYESYAKGQGHVWLNEVPEARGLLE